MASLCLMMDGVLGDLLPHLDQGITELLGGLRCNLSEGLKHMSQWCSVRFMSGEHGGGAGSDISSLHELVSNCHHMWPAIVEHQEVPRNPAAGFDRFKDFFPVWQSGCFCLTCRGLFTTRWMCRASDLPV